MNYKTYAEAKIANPDSEIVTTGNNWSMDAGLVGIFEALILDEFSDSNEDGAHEISDESWVICNPADYCSNLKEFLGAGLVLCCGDIILDESSSVNIIASRKTLYNKPEDCDEIIFILSAAALNGGCKIPSKAEQWTIYNNTLPLSSLTDEQYGKMRRTHDAGMGVEWRRSSIGRWELLSNPTWNAYGIYRIKSKSERELFVEAACNAVESSEFYARMNINICCSAAMRFTVESIYDSGKFKYIDLTKPYEV